MALKPDKLFYSISEVSDHFGVAPSLLRYWEGEFSSLRPKRNKKGTRFYAQKDIEQIGRIHLLVKEKGYTLQGAKEKIKTDRRKIDTNVDVVSKLENIKAFLTKLREQL